MKEDVRKQQTNGYAEHHYMDAFKYRCSADQFTCSYCERDPKQMLTRRCINCMQFACQKCPPDWCSKAAGRYHDFNDITELSDGYRKRMCEFQQKLQQKHTIFLAQLKEVCGTLKKIESDLEKLLHEVDRTVLAQTIALRDEGEKLKNEVAKEISQVTSQIAEQISSLMEKEAKSRQLFKDMHRVIHNADGATIVHSYSRFTDKVEDLIKWRIRNPPSASFKLIEGTDARKPLDLKLSKTEINLVLRLDDVSPPLRNKTEIKLKNQHRADRHLYYGLRFVGADKIITNGEMPIKWGNKRRSVNFTATIEGSISKKAKYYDFVVRQLLPYGNDICMLTRNMVTEKFQIQVQDSQTVFYEYTDSYWYTRRMAVTSDHKILVLNVTTQTLHIVYLDTKLETEISLSIGMQAYELMATSDGKLIFSCEKNGRKH